MTLPGRPIRDLTLSRFSPTIVNALAACPYRVALEREDPSLRRPSLPAAVGNIAHAITEQAWKGGFDQVPAAELRSALASAWEVLVSTEAERLGAAVAPAQPPAPPQWPGIALTRARILRRLKRLLEGRRGQPAPHGEGWIAAEQDFADERSGLYGRIDRLERTGGKIRIVDLKSGMAQREIRPDQRRQLLLYAVLVHTALGEWPAEIAIETAGGSESVLAVDPVEAEEALRAAEGLVRLYNAAARQPDGLMSLASPSLEHCRSCDARIACEPYWDALDPSWPYQGAVRGDVVQASSGGLPASVQIRVERPARLASTVIELYGAFSLPTPAPLALRVVGALVGVGSAKMRATWDTQIRGDERDPATAAPSSSPERRTRA